MKICRRCGESKNIDDYYRHSQMADGHLNICKECIKKSAGENRIKNIDKIRAYDKKRSSLPHRKDLRVMITKKRRIEVKNYERVHNAVTRAIERGQIKRSNTCQVCGKQEKTEGHHDDYNNSLHVIWLCPECHRQYHMGKTERADKVREIVKMMLSIGA